MTDAIPRVAVEALMADAEDDLLTAADLLAALLEHQPWRRDAACVEHERSLFFPELGANVERARAICAGCLVANECLEYAVQRSWIDGVWAGTTRKERAALRRERRLPAYDADAPGRFLAQLDRETERPHSTVCAGALLDGTPCASQAAPGGRYCGIHDPDGAFWLTRRPDDLPPIQLGWKWCPRCRSDHPVARFARNQSRRDGLQAICRDATRLAYLARKRAEDALGRGQLHTALAPAEPAHHGGEGPAAARYDDTLGLSSLPE